ncbi:hypothetical protein AABM17_944 [Neisseria musculi]|uniref:Uncharacterized protein n=1 Tax=Neisseria musculi TaxID=1815583 RepID=A0A7H1MDJ9_9NEIS|nr:hypothetical protein H7A79_0944 [Neisseria musculi]
MPTIFINAAASCLKRQKIRPMPPIAADRAPSGGFSAAASNKYSAGCGSKQRHGDRAVSRNICAKLPPPHPTGRCAPTATGWNADNRANRGSRPSPIHLRGRLQNQKTDIAGIVQHHVPRKSLAGILPPGHEGCQLAAKPCCRHALRLPAAASSAITSCNGLPQRCPIIREFSCTAKRGGTPPDAASSRSLAAPAAMLGLLPTNWVHGSARAVAASSQAAPKARNAMRHFSCRLCGSTPFRRYPIYSGQSQPPAGGQKAAIIRCGNRAAGFLFPGFFSGCPVPEMGSGASENVFC